MQTYMVILAVVLMLFVIFVFFGIWASRYTKVGPNQVLIISGRPHRLPDGSVTGVRVVKGGGTFVWPVYEKVDVLPLEVITVEMPDTKALLAQGALINISAIAQVKIKSDDASIVAAAEHFLSKNDVELKSIVRSLLEKHLRDSLREFNLEEINHFAGAAAAKVQSSSAADFASMGLGMISFTIRHASA